MQLCPIELRRIEGNHILFGADIWKRAINRAQRLDHLLVDQKTIVRHLTGCIGPAKPVWEAHGLNRRTWNSFGRNGCNPSIESVSGQSLAQSLRQLLRLALVGSKFCHEILRVRAHVVPALLVHELIFFGNARDLVRELGINIANRQLQILCQRLGSARFSAQHVDLLLQPLQDCGQVTLATFQCQDSCGIHRLWHFTSFGLQHFKC
mmetsp:Transcript_60125/g.159973  ORF Transcript_60125/g.159973 Transcript_60125/m.159973 type:complete len:207 (+) Transcript_60125:353-973(+)